MIRMLILIVLILTLGLSHSSEPPTISAEQTQGEWKLADTPWPTAQHDFQRTGRSPLLGIVDRPAPTWFREDGFSYGQITIGISNTIYVKTGSETYSVDLEGNLDQSGLPGDDCRSSHTHLDNGYILYAAGLHWWAINSQGDILWSVVFTGGCFDSLTTIRSDGVAYFGYGFGLPYIFGVDAASGTILWGGNEVFGNRPAIGSDGTIYSAILAGGFKALTPDGDLLWAKTDLDYEGSPALGEDGTIYTTTYDPSSGDVNLRAMYTDGSVNWDYPLDLRPCGSALQGPAVGLDGTIYIGAGFQGDDNPQVYFYAVNPDGTLKWRYTRQADSSGIAPPVCVPAVIDNQDNVYFCDTATCHAFDNEGRKLWTAAGMATVASTPVIVDNGLMVFPTLEGIKALAPAVGVVFMPFTAKS